MRKANRTILAVLLAAAAITPLAAKVAPTIVAALASSERPAEDTARDADRKPGAVLDFAGIKRGTKVVELAPGGGYYTRLLSLAVGPGGRVYARGNRFSPAVEAWAKAHPNVLIAITGPDTTALAPEPVDVVWTTLNYHDFKNVKLGESDAAVWFNKLAFAALKPGGVYLVNDHDAAPGTGVSQTNTLHRIEMAAVIKEVEAAGFKLEAQSPVLRHPADDHTMKVVETGIRGHTDQFVLRFRKPKRR
jgi:predicted methyltransferase